MSQTETEVVMGETYTDSVTGVKGVATSLHFYMHGCERVTLEFMHEGKIVQETFDAPRLVSQAGAAPRVLRTGGPGYVPEQRQNPDR